MIRECFHYLSKRGWGSSGQSLGEADTVDNIVNVYSMNGRHDPLRIQVKARNKIAAFLKVPEGADIVALRIDGAGARAAQWYYVIPREFLYSDDFTGPDWEALLERHGCLITEDERRFDVNETQQDEGTG